MGDFPQPRGSAGGAGLGQGDEAGTIAALLKSPLQAWQLPSHWRAAVIWSEPAAVGHEKKPTFLDLGLQDRAAVQNSCSVC